MKQLDSFMGPQRLRSVTWYLNQVKIRFWDHFLVITRVEGREVRTKKRVKGWAGWTPVSEGEMAKFQELVLCTRSDHDEAAPCEIEDGEGLVLQHDRLVKAAAEIKAATTSSRNRKKFAHLMRSDRWRLMQPNAGIL